MAAPAESTTHWSKKPLTLRLISAAVLIPIVVAAVYAGHPAWDLLVTLFGGVMAWEWSSIVARSRSVSDQRRQLVIATMTVFVVYLLGTKAIREVLPPFYWDHEHSFNLVAIIAVIIATSLYRQEIRKSRKPSWFPSFFPWWFFLGFVYVVTPCVAIMDLRADPQVGLQQIFWIVALVIAADTGAYIAGRSIGGPKLAPRVSPNKTWAGLGGAVVSAAIVGAITAFLMDLPSVAILTAISAGLAIIEQIGDLAESAFKRHFGVKDASNIIPGHGGALDRVDGLIAVAAAVAGINYLIGSSVLTWL